MPKRPSPDSSPNSKTKGSGWFTFGLTIVCTVVVLASACWFGPFGHLHRAETEAREIGLTVNSLTEEEWIAAFDAAKQLIDDGYSGVIRKDAMPAPLAKIGFRSANILENGVVFSIGSGHMMNGARVHIHVPTNATHRIDYDGFHTRGAIYFENGEVNFEPELSRSLTAPPALTPDF